MNFIKKINKKEETFEFTDAFLTQKKIRNWFGLFETKTHTHKLKKSVLQFANPQLKTKIHFF